MAATIQYTCVLCGVPVRGRLAFCSNHPAITAERRSPRSVALDEQSKITRRLQKMVATIDPVDVESKPEFEFLLLRLQDTIATLKEHPHG